MSKSGSCELCNESCGTCIDATQSGCTSCDKNSPYPYFNSDINVCSDSCEDGFYLNSNK
jgi:hypothetical protein